MTNSFGASGGGNGAAMPNEAFQGGTTSALCGGQVISSMNCLNQCNNANDTTTTSTYTNFDVSSSDGNHFMQENDMSGTFATTYTTLVDEFDHQATSKSAASNSPTAAAGVAAASSSATTTVAAPSAVTGTAAAGTNSNIKSSPSYSGTAGISPGGITNHFYYFLDGRNISACLAFSAMFLFIVLLFIPMASVFMILFFLVVGCTVVCCQGNPRFKMISHIHQARNKVMKDAREQQRYFRRQYHKKLKERRQQQQQRDGPDDEYDEESLQGGQQQPPKSFWKTKERRFQDNLGVEHDKKSLFMTVKNIFQNEEDGDEQLLQDDDDFLAAQKDLKKDWSAASGVYRSDYDAASSPSYAAPPYTLPVSLDPLDGVVSEQRGSIFDNRNTNNSARNLIKIAGDNSDNNINSTDSTQQMQEKKNFTMELQFFKPKDNPTSAVRGMLFPRRRHNKRRFQSMTRNAKKVEATPVWMITGMSLLDFNKNHGDDGIDKDTKIDEDGDGDGDGRGNQVTNKVDGTGMPTVTTTATGPVMNDETSSIPQNDGDDDKKEDGRHQEQQQQEPQRHEKNFSTPTISIPTSTTTPSSPLSSSSSSSDSFVIEHGLLSEYTGMCYWVEKTTDGTTNINDDTAEGTGLGFGLGGIRIGQRQRRVVLVQGVFDFNKQKFIGHWQDNFGSSGVYPSLGRVQ